MFVEKPQTKGIPSEIKTMPFDGILIGFYAIIVQKARNKMVQ